VKVPAYLSKKHQVIFDLIVLSVAYWLAYVHRFEHPHDGLWLVRAVICWPAVLIIELGVLSILRVPSFSWRYVGLPEATRIALALFLAYVVLVAACFSLNQLGYPTIPLSVQSMNSLLAAVGLIGARGLYRLFREGANLRGAAAHAGPTPVLLIGAGAVGVTIARELGTRPEHGLKVVGFLDDNERKVGMRIGGVEVMGTTRQLAEIAEAKNATRVLITMADTSSTQIRHITNACRDCGLGVRIVPGLSDVVSDRGDLSGMRDVALEDLIDSPKVEIDELEVSRLIRGQTIMVTGIDGDVGSEISREVCKFKPGKIILVERSDHTLLALRNELAAIHRDIEVVPKLADVTDELRMERLIAQSSPSMVFHTVAHRHVPLLEAHPAEAVRHNIGGTRVVASLARKYGVERFVLVSTDKAINPISVMGATMRVAELMLQTFAPRGQSRFMCVRVGNVLRDAGNVVQVFRTQIERGGPVTVTHPEMQRYFMPTPSACKLILQAACLGHGGEVFSLDAGEPTKILDLARDLITLSGYRPDSDIEIQFTGIRPGEKLLEDRFDAARAIPSGHSLIWVNPDTMRSSDPKAFDVLLSAAHRADTDEIRACIGKFIPDFAQPVAAPTSAPHRAYYVGNLPSSVTEPGVRDAFKDWGTVHDVQIARTKAGRPRGFAFVKLDTPPSDAALSRRPELEGRTLPVSGYNEVNLRTTWSIPPRSRSSSSAPPATSSQAAKPAPTTTPLPLLPPPPATHTEGFVYINASFEDHGAPKLLVDVPRRLLLEVSPPRRGSAPSRDGTETPRSGDDTSRGEELRFVVSSSLCRVTPGTATYKIGGPPARFELTARRGSTDGNTTVTITVLRDGAFLHIERLTLSVSEATPTHLRAHERLPS
jgi:FlaA1/EpsC-like NDP-sugar epimerase